MVAETKKTDILASLGLVKAPASLTCLGKARVGEKGPRCQAGYLLTFSQIYTTTLQQIWTIVLAIIPNKSPSIRDLLSVL